MTLEGSGTVWGRLSRFSRFESPPCRMGGLFPRAYAAGLIVGQLGQLGDDNSGTGPELPNLTHMGIVT